MTIVYGPVDKPDMYKIGDVVAYEKTNIAMPMKATCKDGTIYVLPIMSLIVKILPE